MLNKPTYGSQPIKNEQSGSKPTQLERMNKSIQQFKDYFDEQYPCDDDDSCGDNMNDLDRTRWSQYESLIALSRILTAAKVSTVDEVVQMLERQPLSPEDIERAAETVIGKKFDDMSDDYRAWYHAFIQGANFAKQPHSNEVDEPIYCNCETPTLGTNLTRCGTCGEWFKRIV
mgnify:CR=1 FL=1